jgi:hypothetical protein
MVPIINVKCDGDDLLPQAGIIRQFTQPRFRRRTTAATFRSIKFQQRRLAIGTLKDNGIRVGDAAKHEGKRTNEFHDFASMRHAGAGLFPGRFPEK